ncbi:MAG: hypothetical protein OFPII_34960 [Osedax symbiont Rs1]|nr:MAG: hypothetical protein OFPII_34960 [Osedax symbiont Rs1]
MNFSVTCSDILSVSSPIKKPVIHRLIQQLSALVKRSHRRILIGYLLIIITA